MKLIFKKNKIKCFIALDGKSNYAPEIVNENVCTKSYTAFKSKGTLHCNTITAPSCFPLCALEALLWPWFLNSWSPFGCYTDFSKDIMKKCLWQAVVLWPSLHREVTELGWGPQASWKAGGAPILLLFLFCFWKHSLACSILVCLKTYTCMYPV